MEFFKAHGTANDFVVMADLDDVVTLDAPFVRALCDRRRGVGADGVLRLGPPRAGGDVFMDYRNADGSIVEMCGNGVRVVAKHLVDHGFVGSDTVVVETRAGTKKVAVRRGEDGCVVEATVDMGRAIWDADRIPYEPVAPGSMVDTLAVDGAQVELTAVSMGNPHAVLVVDDVSLASVGGLGPRLETHERFPKGVNVEFAEVVADDLLRLRVWERGVGETAACGTGACAAAVALHRRGFVGSDVAVHLPGGVLRIRDRGDKGVLLTGAAVEVARGTLHPSWLAAARAGTFDTEVAH